MNKRNWSKSSSLVLVVLIALFIISSISVSAVNQIKAFPGAEGFGAYTPGGRGGQVFTVDNLNDSGRGSIREAVEAEGPRTVVFNVSGTIRLKSDLVIRNPYITIAGQSAPGDGICIADYNTTIKTDNVIIRYLRFRLGDKSRQEDDALSIDDANNVIIDHVSASWSIDETLSVSKSDNITIQWSIISESLNDSLHTKGPHGYGSLVRGEYGSKYSFHHNLWAHHRSRTPRPGNYVNYREDPEGLLADFSNNVIYNWGGSHGAYNSDKDSVSKYNFRNNYFKAGFDSRADSYIFREQSAKAKGYFAGNYMDGSIIEDWDLVKFQFRNYFGQNPDELAKTYKQSKPFEVADFTLESAPEAFDNVLTKAGAFPRDLVDIRVVDSVWNGKGNIIDSQKDVGGWPELKTREKVVDSDQDGIPNKWENSNGLDPRDSSDASDDKDNDGYTNLEEYLNSMAESLLGN